MTITFSCNVECKTYLAKTSKIMSATWQSNRPQAIHDCMSRGEKCQKARGPSPGKYPCGARHPRRRDAGDDLALEDSIENQDGHRRDKRSGEGQPALDVAPLLQHQQADGEPDLPGEDDEQPEKVVPEAKEAQGCSVLTARWSL